MNLTLFTDYALRVLMYLGARPGEVVAASTIADAFGISSDHVAKAAKWLTREGYVSAVRGQRGGITLARAPASIRLGELVRAAEPHAGLLACFEPGVDGCVLTRSCRLRGILREAERSFFNALDAYTLADVLCNAPELVRLLVPLRRGKT